MGRGMCRWSTPWGRRPCAAKTRGGPLRRGRWATAGTAALYEAATGYDAVVSPPAWAIEVAPENLHGKPRLLVDRGRRWPPETRLATNR